MIKPAKDELLEDTPGLDAVEEGTDAVEEGMDTAGEEIDDAINDETPTELAVEETDLGLAGARLVEPPPPPPPQAHSNIHAANNSIRLLQSNIERAIAVLVFNPMLFTLVNKKRNESTSVKHSHDTYKAQN